MEGGSWCRWSAVRFDDFEFKIDFFPPDEGIQILFPETPQEAPAGMATIQIDEPFQSTGAPQVQKRNVGRALTKAHRGVEVKHFLPDGQVAKGITVEMVAVGQIGGKVGIRPVGATSRTQPPGRTMRCSSMMTASGD